MPRALELIVRAARLYYEEQRTVAEIAAALSVSQPTVSRLLADARACGIVQFTVRDPRQRPAD